MKKIYLKLYDFFSKIASYFLKKSLNNEKKKSYDKKKTKKRSK